MPLAAFADIKKLLPELTKANLSDYPRLDFLLPSVDTAIENYLGRWIDARTGQTETVYITGPTRMVPLKGLPVGSVTSITVDAEAYDLEDATKAGYGLRLAGSVEQAEIVVVYDGGPSSIPADWTRAATLQAAYEFQNADHIGATSVSTDGGTVNKPALQLLRHVRELLDPDVHPMKYT